MKALLYCCFNKRWPHTASGVRHMYILAGCCKGKKWQLLLTNVTSSWHMWCTVLLTILLNLHLHCITKYQVQFIWRQHEMILKMHVINDFEGFIHAFL